MFSSFSLLSIPFSVPRFLQSGRGLAVEINPVEVHDVEILPEKRARVLKHLLKLNHVNHSIIYHHLQFHNHMPHILASAYLLGANGQHLADVYDEESKELEKWQDSPGEISEYDWREYLGDRRYQRAYVDFFEDQLVLNGYDWRKLLDKYLFQGKEPLINCVIAGLGHPLIHLGYAYELSSRELAMEALGLTTTSYNFLHKYIDVNPKAKEMADSTPSLISILNTVARDQRFDALFDHKGGDNIEALFMEHEELVLEYWNTWSISCPKQQFEDSQHAATALLAATQGAGNVSYDFFLVHILTTSHAVRILLPMIPTEFHVPLLRQWWLLALAVYISQLRPLIETQSILGYDVDQKNWHWVETEAIEGIWACDAHFVKAIRAMREMAKTWDDKDMFFLKAAVKFADNFQGWGGFSPSEEAGNN